MSAPALVRATFPVGVLGCNCSVVVCPETHEALVVDAGDDADVIAARLEELGARVVAFVHTHAHFDHVMAAPELAARTGAETALHESDRWLWDHVEVQLAMFGMPSGRGPLPAPTRVLTGGETLTFGRREARVVHTPGHTPGSTCFFLERAGERPLLFSGDTLFAGSIGRTDLWGGSFEQIVQSIRGPLFDLPGDTLVVPGHGPETSIELERGDNPFVGGRR